MRTPNVIKEKLINDLCDMLNNYPRENGIPKNIAEYLEIANFLNTLISVSHFDERLNDLILGMIDYIEENLDMCSCYEEEKATMVTSLVELIEARKKWRL